jgi:hypothetical protein
MTDPLFTLIATSLILLSAERVHVHIEKQEVPHLTKAECHYWRDQWRKGGPAYQAACIQEINYQGGS